MVRDCGGSTPARCHAQEGIAPHSATLGGANRARGAGPGARVPKRVMSTRQAPKACRPVTFCSMIEAARASKTRSVRVRRSPGLRRWVAAMRGWWCASNGVGSSSDPSRAGSWAIAHSAPGPHAEALIEPSPLGAVASVAMPCGVRLARQNTPRSWRCAGSPRPRRIMPTVVQKSSGCRGRYTVSTRAERAGASAVGAAGGPPAAAVRASATAAARGSVLLMEPR
jgi:hypothetical protein